MSASDNIIFVNTSSARTLTLPAPTNGRLLTIKDSTGSAATNNITINPNASETIDGASSFTINFNWGEVELQSNGTNWFTNKAANSTLSLAAIGATPNANAASLSGQVLNLQPASASFGGVVTTGTQTFAGDKTFTGVTGFADGSASAPGLTFSADTNTGIFRAASDDLGITTGGAIRIEVTNSNTDLTNTLRVKTGGSFGSPNLVCSGDTNTGVVWGEADDIYFSTGGTNRFSVDSGGIVGIESGDLKIKTAGKGLFVKEGTNAKMGTATMVAGTVTVSTTAVTASSRIFLTVQSLGTVAVATPVAVTARTAGTSFTISSSAITDTSVVAWMLVEPA